MPQRIMRLPAVLEFTGLSETQLEEKIKRGEFPRPIKLSDSGRTIGWIESELIDWLNSRITARDAAVAAAS